MPKANILIVEDNRIVAEDTRITLEKLQFGVCGIVPSGEESLNRVEAEPPDLVLMDIELKGEMDGIEAADQIRSRFNIPVVYVTSYADEDVLERAKMTEPFGYVIKPFEDRELNSAIEIALYKHKMERKLKESEEKYRLLVKSMKDVIVRLSPTGKLLYISPSIKEFGGYDPESVIGNDMSKFIERETDSNRAVELLPKALTTHQSGTFEFLFKPKDKKPFYVEFIHTPILEDNKTTAIQLVLRDISKRKLAEETLRKSNERFRTVADFTYDWEYWVAPDGRWVYVSPSCERITGYGPEAFMNNPGLFKKVVHPDDHSMVSCHFDEKHGGETLSPIDFRIITRSGEVRWVSHVCQPVYGADGTCLGRRGSNRDINKRKQMEQELQQAGKMEAIATLAGGIAHEFNNALMGIMGTIELLQMDSSKDERRDRHFAAMKSSGYRMSRLTDQLLAYAQGGKYRPKDLKLDDFVMETLPILHHDLGPEVRVETHFSKVPYIKADPTQMQMLLLAVLTNSNEAMEEGGRIKITAQNKDVDEEFAKENPGLEPGRYVCLAVEDNGMGMDEETRAGIFEPFFTTKFQGRGMGMAAAYGIVKNHDGWIYVDSEPGKGTVVRIYLPAISAEGRERGAEGVKQPEMELNTGEGTILMIEDEAVVIEVTQMMLEMLGYRVMVAKTGKVAVHMAETFDGLIDLVLLDIKLPDIDGRDLYPMLMKARSNLKVIVCSGYAIDGPAREILDAGARDFIQKPFSMAALSEIIKKVLE